MENNFNQPLWEKILLIDLKRVFDRLVHKLDFTEDRAEDAINGYRQYLYLVNTVGNLTPSEDVDEAWHAHVLHLPAYFRDCMSAFGRVIWHIPKPIINGKVICSGECNAGQCNNYKPAKIGTDCEALQGRSEMLSFTINVPADEYLNESAEEKIPFYNEFVEKHFA